MIYKCLHCERVYSKEQLNVEKTLESFHILHLKFFCPLCNTSNFELQKEIYKRLGDKVKEGKIL